MLDKLTEIAPLATWGLTVSAALLLLCGFVTMGHAMLTRQAFGATFGGVLVPAVLETMVRWTVVLLSGGLLLWGVALHWPLTVLAPLGVLSGGALLLEGVARLRG